MKTLLLIFLAAYACASFADHRHHRNNNTVIITPGFSFSIGNTSDDEHQYYTDRHGNTYYVDRWGNRHYVERRHHRRHYRY
jgi:hypothetical protein